MHLTWPPDDPLVLVAAPDDGPPRTSFPHGRPGPEQALGTSTFGRWAREAPALVEVALAGEGRDHRRGTAGRRHTGHLTASRLRSTGWEQGPDGDPVRTLTVTATDRVTGLEVTAVRAARPGLPVVRCRTHLRNTGEAPVTLEFVSSLVASGFTRPGRAWARDLRVAVPANGWCGEVRWREHTLPELGLDEVGSPEQPECSRRRLAVTSTGSWSTAEHLPMAALRDLASGRTWLWEIVHNGSWHWELGDRHGDLDLVVSGPTAQEHQWWRTLAPGETFDAVPVDVACVRGDVEDAVRALTRHRRAERRPHSDHAALPVVFNDYMNCLEGDPTTARLLPLVAAASAAGAEYFCVDAGWYADDGTWWDGVGDWQPSRRRFPGGIGEVFERVRSAGMVPGLWLEPEVVGVRSPVAERLPAEAFFRRNGARVSEAGRHQLDLRHPAALEHVDEVVDRLVDGYGLGYLKLDYNIDAGPGTQGPDHPAGHLAGPGDGLLGHNRALLAWLDAVLDRHPGLVIENCGSGGMRMDAAMLARTQLQSLTDQRDHRLLAAIAAAAPSAVPAEQAASWVYPQPEFDAETIAFTVVNGLLGRIHLSGRIDLMAPAQLELVRTGLEAYRRVRRRVATGLPFWPLGLPGWTDPWLALGLDDGGAAQGGHGAGTAPGSALLAVWRRGGDEVCHLPVRRLQGRQVAVEVLYPRAFPGSATWDARTGRVRVHLPAPLSARLLLLTATEGR